MKIPKKIVELAPESTSTSYHLADYDTKMYNTCNIPGHMDHMGMLFPAPKKRSQKMIGILGSDTTKDGNPLCFFVVVGSAYAVESNHRDVGERCLETKPLEVSKAVDFKFHICHRHSSFIIYHHSSFIILSLVLEDRSQDLLDDFLDHFRHVLFRGREGFAVKKLFSSKVSTSLTDTLSRKVDAKQKVAKTYDFSQSHTHCW